ncbi:uncharacterized protein LOC142635472 [Castanea sativa]|uniref:uncharacterized protein LOC142635472 n=1 Tax=Castanea sativa TaxID=21020 RepID=UPI003F64B945
MKGDPNKRNKNKYCCFHRDHGHDMDKCYDLKQQIENLIRQEKLRNFLGRDHKDEKLKGKLEEPSWPPLGEIRVIIGGTSARQSFKSRKTYLKVTMGVQWILSYPTFQQMRLGRDQLRPINSPLVGFGGMKVQPVGTITLPVVVGAYPQQIAKEVNFLVVDYSSSYNAIIGKPTLNSWKAITSTYHLSIKFPTDYGVGQVQGDQLATKEHYLAMLAMDKHG